MTIEILNKQLPGDDMKDCLPRNVCKLFYKITITEKCFERFKALVYDFKTVRIVEISSDKSSKK